MQKSILAVTLSLGFLSNALLSPPRPPQETPLKEIKGYRQWHKTNKTPFPVLNPVAMLCREATPQEEQAQRDANPHVDTYITVYVNDKGKSAMLGNRRKRFPVGSLVIKEKWEAPDGRELSTPSHLKLKLMTVMLKREAGYNPKRGDWEYLVVNAKGSLLERGKIKKCQTCHQEQQASDYLFRSYFTNQ